MIISFYTWQSKSKSDLRLVKSKSQSDLRLGNYKWQVGKSSKKAGNRTTIVDKSWK